MQSVASTQTEVVVEKQVIYQQETTIDLSGSRVEGENQLPPTFFVMKMKAPKAESLLEERLQFGLRDYNELGF
jgi:hypothetical protein